MSAITQQQLVARARKTLDEIEQLHVDIAHWNRCVRKPDEAAIDPDPDGNLATVRAHCQEVIRKYEVEGAS